MGDSTSDGSKDLPAVEDLHRELVELRQQLERERLLRMMMEERSRDLETQLVNQPRHPHLSSHLPSPINLKVVSTCAAFLVNPWGVGSLEDVGGVGSSEQR